MGEKYLGIYHHTERRLIKDLEVFADTEQQFDALKLIYDRETEKIFRRYQYYIILPGEHKFKLEQFDHF